MNLHDVPACSGNHPGIETVLEDLAYAGRFGANLLLNTAPLPDGQIDSQDVETLRQTGAHLRDKGFPTA